MGTGSDPAIPIYLSSLEEHISSLLGLTATGLKFHFYCCKVTEEDINIRVEETITLLTNKAQRNPKQTISAQTAEDI